LGATIKKPAMHKVYTLCGVYLGFAVLSILITMVLLSTYKRKKTDKKQNQSAAREQCGLLVGTIKHLKKPYQLLIIPLTLWLGFVQAFIGADFTKVNSLPV
jgi:hypothetical protein